MADEKEIGSCKKGKGEEGGGDEEKRKKKKTSKKRKKKKKKSAKTQTVHQSIRKLYDNVHGFTYQSLSFILRISEKTEEESESES